MNYCKNLAITILSNLICLCLILTFSILFFNKTSFPKSFLREINQNFGDSSIISFNTSCKDPIKLGFWGGMRKGCDCIGINSLDIKTEHRNHAFNGSCSKNETLAGCKEIKKIDPININNYEGYKFCPIKGNNYAKLLENSVPPESNCTEGKKQCGILDTRGQKLCLNSNEICPINDIIINNDNNTINENSKINYTTIKLNNEKYLHYTNQAINKQLIINFKLSNDFPCIYPGEFSWYYYYPLEPNNGTCATNISDKTRDDRYEKIDIINKSILYKDNNIHDKIKDISNYPFYNLNNDNITFYTRTFLGLEKKCMESNGFSFDYFNSLNSKINVIQGLIILIIVFFGLLIFGFITFWAYFIDNKIIAGIFFLGVLTYKIYNSCSENLIKLKLSLMVFEIILLIPSILTIININKLKDIKFACGDELTNGLIKIFIEKINTIKAYLIIILVFISISIITNIVMIIVELITKEIDDDKIRNLIEDNEDKTFGPGESRRKSHGPSQGPSHGPLGPPSQGSGPSVFNQPPPQNPIHSDSVQHQVEHHSDGSTSGGGKLF